MTFVTRPLTPVFGAEVEGVDLAQPMDDARFAELRDLWLEKKLLLFRGQKLEEADMIRFGRHFGDLEVHVRNDAGSKNNPEILLVTNKKENGKAIGVLGDHEAPWHSDQIYMATPTWGTMLYALAVPTEGGNTFICDMATAYARLPEALKQKIEGKQAINSAAYFNARNNGGMNPEQLKRVPPVSHPLVRTHPVLGRKSLYMSLGHTCEVVGMEPEEGEKLLESLREHAIRAEHIYEHTWRVGDMLLWDNTQTMHRREPFDGAQIRLMKRISFACPPGVRAPF